jgi:Na+/proline symporter
MSPSLLIAFILYGLCIPFSSAEIWQRIFAATDDRTVRVGMIGSGVCILLLGCAITLMGLSARSAFPDIDPKDAVAIGMSRLLPSGLLGLGLVGLFASIMSSIDTLVFYLATSFAKDYHPESSDRRLEALTRKSIVIITLACALGATLFQDLIKVIITVAGVSASIAPPLIASFFFSLKESAVVKALYASCLYIFALVLFGIFVPEAAMGSLFISAIVLFFFQKWEHTH